MDEIGSCCQGVRERVGDLVTCADAAAVRLSAGFVGKSLGRQLDRAELGAIVVHHDGTAVTFGSRAPMGSLRTTHFEFVRALTGRRSLDQIAALDWEGSVAPEHVVLSLFSPRSTPLVE